MRRALLSVTDKSGLVDLGRSLLRYDFELVASGGTARALSEAGLPVRSVEEITGQAEILGGRVKTLHPAIHAGILAKTIEELGPTGFDPIEVVVVNLYDFSGAVASGKDEAGLVESIDIGGPTMLRAAAKNFQRVTVLPAPDCYDEFAAELEQNDGATSLEFRRRMAGRLFATTARYDTMIARDLFAGGDRNALRYGENPHQQAWWSAPGGLAGLGLTLHGGKELSYNNLLDVVATLKLSLDLPEDCCAIVKHTNPCGVGRGVDASASLERALAGDPVSAFGGIVAFGRSVDGACAERLSKQFLEVVLAPDFDDAAREILGKKKNLRWLSVDGQRFARATRGNVRVYGTLELGQDEDDGFPELERWQLAAGPTPDEQQLAAAELAWRVSKHVKSNAIVLADANGTLGIGAGQMSRVDSSRLAVEKAGDHGHALDGCAAASDGFFPFADGLESLAAAGAKIVVQPGGSIRDDEVVAAAERLQVSLMLTGVRHFRH